MNPDDVVRHEDLADRVTAEVCERRTSSGSVLLWSVRVVWTMRPLVPLRPVLNQCFAAMFFWTAGWASIQSSSRMSELVGRAFIAAFGSVLSYLGLVEFFNRTTVVLDRSQLWVRQGPLPWPGSVMVPVANVTAVGTVAAGGEEPGNAVCVVAGLKEFRAFRLPREAAQNVATFLEQSINRVRREQLQPGLGLYEAHAPPAPTRWWPDVLMLVATVVLAWRYAPVSGDAYLFRGPAPSALVNLVRWGQMFSEIAAIAIGTRWLVAGIPPRFRLYWLAALALAASGWILAPSA